MSTVSETTGLRQITDQLAQKTEEELGPKPSPVDFTPSLSEFLDRSTGAQLVVGGPRAGKTLLASRYQRAILEQRGSGEPVPVRFPLATWRYGTSVRRWLVQFLVREWALSEGQAKELLTAGLIHPIFDGVDELTARRLPQFLREVEELSLPVLLTSRPADLGGWLSPVELQPPKLDATLRRWAKIADEVRRDPQGPLGQALSDPVNRYAFDLTYSNREADPSGLLDRSAFPDAASIERHLLDGLTHSAQGYLRQLASRARTGEDKITWWELPDFVPRSRVPIVALVIGVLVAAAMTEWITSLAATLPGTAGPWIGQVLVSVVIVLSVAGLVYHPIRSRRPFPARIGALQPPRRWWLVLGGVVSALTLATAVWLDRGWVAAMQASLTGVAVVGLFWLSATAERPEEDLMDAPGQAAWQDVQVLGLRLLAILFLVGGIGAAAIGPTAFFNDRIEVSATSLAVAVSSVAWSASARCCLSSSTLFVLLLPVRNELRALVRREGGVYRFRDQDVRDKLAEPQFKHLVRGTLRPAAIHVSTLRHVVAAEACRRLGVDGVIGDDKAGQEFKDQIAAEIKENIDAIVVSTAETRRSYVDAKDRYVERFLRVPLDAAELVSMLAPFPIGLVLAGWAVLSFTWRQNGVWSSAGIIALAVAAIVVSFALWGLLRRPSGRYIVVVVGMIFAGIAAYQDRVDPWIPLVAGGLGVLAMPATRPVARLRKRVEQLATDDPQNWPAASESHRAKDARQKAERAYHAWLGAMVERVVPFVAQRLTTEEKRLYTTVLPPAKDMPGLGDVTSVAQYVPTETSKTLARMMTFMSRGAIGISGPRGVGKSTVLNVIGVLGLGARPDDVALHVSAPTNYAARDFLVHLYTKLCRTVVDAEPDPQSARRRRRWPWLVAALAGAVVALGGWQWPWLVSAAGTLPKYWRPLVIAGGVAVAVLSLMVWVRPARTTRRPDDDVVREARRRLEELRFVETTTITKAVTAKPPAIAEFGGSHARALAGQVKTLPELVDEFKAFLVMLTGRMTREPRGRVVVCIDELDKIASPVEAERFLNDLKAVFGVERCFFLVTVSDDALASFSGRSLAVRTAFDSAFNSVLRVRRFALSDTRLLLMQRTARLSEPFVWLCHVLSGGLPRDLNRTAYDLYDLVRQENLHDLSALAHRLVSVDRQAVTESLTDRLTDRFDESAVRLRRHILDTARLELTSAALMSCGQLYLPTDAADDLLLINEQLHAYLGYVAAMLRLFRENTQTLVTRLSVAGTGPVESLALARTWLATDPVVAAAHVEDWTRFETQ